MQQVSPQPEATPTTPATSPGNTCQSGTPASTVAPLPERIDALNYSLDPWERTGAAPQGWANHLQQSMVPIQGYIQLRPQATGSLPVFGATCQSAPGGTGDTDAAEQPAPRRLGKASPSVSIFARDPLCKDTCRYCRSRPCDVGIEHDDHTCYDCEQRLLHPDGVPGGIFKSHPQNFVILGKVISPLIGSRRYENEIKKSISIRDWFSTWNLQIQISGPQIECKSHLQVFGGSTPIGFGYRIADIPLQDVHEFVRVVRNLPVKNPLKSVFHVN